jgi:hypothetical protein
VRNDQVDKDDNEVESNYSEDIVEINNGDGGEIVEVEE